MTSICHNFNEQRCHTCSLLPQPYAEQLCRKRAELSRLFNLELGYNQDIPDLVALKNPLGSRYRTKLAVGGETEQPIMGFPTSSGHITDLPDCPLLVDPLNAICSRIRLLITELNIAPYDIQTRKGELKYVIARKAWGSEDCLLRFVLRSPALIGKIRKCAQLLQRDFPEVVVVSANIQPEPMAVVEGPDEHIVTKRHSISERFAGLEIASGPQNFTQVTPEIAEQIYTLVASRLAQSGAKKLLDLYCGIGCFSLLSASAVLGIIGVELSSSAIYMAKRNALALGRKDIQFFCGDAELYLSTQKLAPDAIIVNPPRGGLSPGMVEELKRLKPQELYYSSCNPETLVRDLKAMQGLLSIKEVRAFDMFPLSSHIEVLVIAQAI